ncbi:5'/3'-nucleotidase SurE [Paracoccaceae bacterium]|nr:5'/3'-nucleotidase SurE [Paracoccaceae bacterium]
MRILITNDDGFNADGIKSLKKIALEMSAEENIFVVAPSANQSAKSRSISYKTEFHITKKSDNQYSVDGTPTDCVIFALDHLMKNKKPDLILSGINWGYNLAEDVFYSGTIAAAMEGADRGILSIALSQAYSGAKEKLNPFLFAEKCSSKLCLSIYQHFSLSRKKIAFNVNFPVKPKKRYPDSIKITPIGQRNISNFAINLHIKSENLYLAKIDTIKKNTSSTPEDDYTNCLKGYITVSPISMNIIQERSFKELKKVQF